MMRGGEAIYVVGLSHASAGLLNITEVVGILVTALGFGAVPSIVPMGVMTPGDTLHGTHHFFLRK